MENGISIIIPTFNRVRMLRNTLTGLSMQEHFNRYFEVVIVDNGSSQDMRQHICHFEKYFPIKFIKRRLINKHFRPGSARNIGALCSEFEKIIFLDSDCIPSKMFLSEHWKVLSLPNSRFATIGHRVFINSAQVTPHQILFTPAFLQNIGHVRSMSNYLQVEDRRLQELINSSFAPLK